MAKYFADTDTLYIELYDAEIDETHDLDEDTLPELDTAGRLYAIAVEHASDRMEIPAFSYEQIPAPNADALRTGQLTSPASASAPAGRRCRRRRSR